MKNDRNKNLTELTALLERFGADQAKWPADKSAELADLLVKRGEDNTVRALVEEHRALDRLLDRAPAGNVTPDLKARILAAAEKQRGVSDNPPVPDNIVPLDAARRSRSLQTLRPFSNWRHAAAASALAASFMLGLYLGVSGLAAPAIDEALQFASGGLTGQAYETADPLGAFEFEEDLL